jgi:hypothetical protein
LKACIIFTHRAFENVANGDFPMAPKPTPTAKPSIKGTQQVSKHK